MREAGVVLDRAEQPIHWHTPDGRTAGGIPDTNTLWEVIWDNRHNLYGVAHSHPGSGLPGPSFTDVTTFAAIEDALGQRLEWPIISMDRVAVCRWVGPDRHTYRAFPVNGEPGWVEQLRAISR